MYVLFFFFPPAHVLWALLCLVSLKFFILYSSVLLLPVLQLLQQPVREPGSLRTTIKPPAPSTRVPGVAKQHKEMNLVL